MHQIKADFPVLFVQPGGELRDQAVGPYSGLLTMPSHLLFLDESAPSILADCFLRASDFLQVGTGKLLAELKGLLPSLRQYIYWRNARQDQHNTRRDRSLRLQQLHLDGMVWQGISPDWSCIKQLRMDHARHQSPFRSPGSINVRHKPSQFCSTLDGFTSCDL